MNVFAARAAMVFAALVLAAPAAHADNSMFVAVKPCRIVDTRGGMSPSPIAANTNRKFDVVGVSDYSAQGGSATTCGIPGFTAGGLPVVTAVAMNVVAVKPAGQGNLVVFPSDTAAPTASTINFAGPSVSLNIANGVIVPVRQDLEGNDVTVRPTQSVDVVIDVTGYFTAIPLHARFNATSPDLIAGFSANSAAAGVSGATVAGGGESSFPNQVSGDFGAVGGGEGNVAGPGTWAVAAGGFGNLASGNAASILGGQDNGADGSTAAVDGGHDNHANGLASAIVAGEANSATARAAVVIGGDTNLASGHGAVVLGGTVNKATALDAIVVGGAGNTASGPSSFAAGNRAQATHDGSFVWADDTDADFSSTGENTFRVRATGGVRFVTAVNGSGVGTSNCTIDVNGNLTCSGTIGSSSDRDAKQSFAPVDGAQVLERVAALPIRTWTFKNDRQGARHLGPMAQDFHGAFRLGADPKHIATVDEEGVALAAIQGLYEIVRAQGATIEQKDREIAELEERLAKIERKVDGNPKDDEVGR